MRSDRTDDDEHDPDGAPLSAEWARLDALYRAATRRLTEIDAAIAAFDAGTYGVCSRCGRPISAGRLEVQPAASRCVDCADKR
jgi:RNA polymerase-binding transcription factor DksA